MFKYVCINISRDRAALVLYVDFMHHFVVGI